VSPDSIANLDGKSSTAAYEEGVRNGFKLGRAVGYEEAMEDARRNSGLPQAFFVETFEHGLIEQVGPPPEPGR
jgi:flagellar biosynthesis/type III secretory pathway protein FliH